MSRQQPRQNLKQQRSLSPCREQSLPNIKKGAGLPSLARKFLHHLDQRPLAEACQAVGIPENKGLKILQKLKSLDVIQPAPAPFSEAEEAFFASKVDPIDECNEPFRGPLERALHRIRYRIKGSGR